MNKPFQLNKHLGATRRVLLGLLLIVVILVTPVIIWLCFWEESFFSLTRRLPADVLVVESWIGPDATRAAGEEFQHGDYKYVVAIGDLIAELIPDDHLSYAETARQELMQSGIANERIILASTGEIKRDRTFKAAVAAWQALESRGVHPTTVNVFALGPHARRSRLVYEKVFAPGVPVGVIAFVPSEYRSEPWWLSRERIRCLVKETVGYPFELLLNSGRISNSPMSAVSPLGDQTRRAEVAGSGD
jgi:hypothetical protein